MFRHIIMILEVETFYRCFLPMYKNDGYNSTAVEKPLYCVFTTLGYRHLDRSVQLTTVYSLFDKKLDRR